MPSELDPPGDHTGGHEGGRVSRRRFLRVGGSAVLLSHPLAQGIVAAADSDWDFTASAERIVFRYKGVECWAIEPRFYSGNATLEVRRSDRANRCLDFALVSAQYPGWGESADLTCSVDGSANPQMTISLQRGGHEAKFAIESVAQWLSGGGSQPLRIHEPGLAVPLPGFGSVSVAGDVEATCWHPAYKQGTTKPLHVAGVVLVYRGSCRLLGDFGKPLEAAEFAWGVADPRAYTPLATPETGVFIPRTIFALRGLVSSEVIVGSIPCPKHAHLEAAREQPFESILGEAAASNPDTPRWALEVGGGGGVRQLSFTPAVVLRRPDGSRLSLDLDRVIYQVTPSAQGIQKRLSARVRGNQVHDWGLARGIGLDFGGAGADTGHLEMEATSGTVERLECVRAVRMVAVAAGGDLVSVYSRDGALGTVHFGSPPSTSLVLPVLYAGPDAVEGMLPLVETEARIHCRRPESLLDVDLRFRNVELRADSRADAPLNLGVGNPMQEVLVAVDLPPQHFAEQTFPDLAALQQAAEARAAGPSTLAHRLWNPTPGVAPWQTTLTLGELLELVSRPLSLTPAAGESRPLKELQHPAPFETSLELPYRLMLSPTPGHRWLWASTAPRTLGKLHIVELWHARLGRQLASDERTICDYPHYYHIEANGQLVRLSPELCPPAASLLSPQLRAVWSPDLAPSGSPGSAVEWALEPRDRQDIVKLTSCTGPSVQPVEARRLLVSPLGAWADLRGHWTDPSVSLQEWRQQTVAGRDQYVRAVRRGYLFPTGHRAICVTVTERELRSVPSPDGGQVQVACLIKRRFVRTTELEREFGPTAWAMPLRRARVLTEVTPDLDLQPQALDNIPPGNAFWPTVNNGQPVCFAMEATDWEGSTVHLELPLLFVDGPVVDDPSRRSELKDITSAYRKGTRATGNSAEGDAHSDAAILDLYRKGLLPAGLGRPPAEEDRESWFPWKVRAEAALASRKYASDLRGQGVAFAPVRDGHAGETRFPTGPMSFTADYLDSQPSGALPFRPAMLQAQIQHPAASALGALRQAVTVEVTDFFRDHGFGDPSTNPKEAFLKLVGEPPQVSWPKESFGGLAAPDFKMAALSRSMGPIGAGDLSKLSDLAVDFETDFFKGSAPKLLGTIPLTDIIKQVVPVTPEALKTRAVPVLALVQDIREGIPRSITVTYEWNPELKETKDGLVRFHPSPAKPASLKVTRVVPLSGDVQASSETSAQFTDFGLELAELITVHFTSVAFTSRNGGAPSVDVKVGKVEFQEALRFLAELQQHLPLGDKLRWSIGVDTAAVSAGLSLALPAIPLGWATITSARLGVGVRLNFDGPACFRFAFGERFSPFLVSVSGFAGGGFVAIEIDTKGGRALEAAIEFGGLAMVDLGVASASLYLMVGVYLRVETKGAEATGYVRCGGQVNLLGFISVSVEFYLGLRYDFPKNILTGTASYTINVRVCFLTKSITLTVSRTLSGHSGVAALPSGTRVASAPGAIAGLLPALLRADQPMTFAEHMTLKQWEIYCKAFA